MPLNIDMLERLAQPGGEGRSYSSREEALAARLPSLDEIFARVVRDRWAPRNPCTDPQELARLEARTTRGECLSPIILPGDTVFVDPLMAPEPGDIVSLAISERFAAEQNANPPPSDCRPCRAGDPWLKLFVPYAGIGMLHERYGHSITSTFMACESPDDTPILRPVRNVLRNGRLLFAPPGEPPLLPSRGMPVPVARCDVSGGQIGVAAATDVATSAVSGVSVGSSHVSVTSLTIGPYAWPVDIVLTATGSWTQTGTGGINTLQLGIGLLTTDFTSNPINIQLPNVVNDVGLIATEITYTLAANTTQTYYLNASCLPSGQLGSVSITATLKAESLKR